MKFSKMHGNGNDFIVIEDLNNEYLGKEEEIAQKMCHRRFGIGADGILIVRKNENCDIEMVIINSDGSYAAMCGNGIRCFAKYVYEKGIVKKDVLDVLTGDGVKRIFLEIENDKVKSINVNMGFGDFKPKNIPALCEEEIIEKKVSVGNGNFEITSLLMGVPHTIIFEEEKYPIECGRDIEKYELFPQGTNVNFCKVIDRNTMEVRTWERGAGPTLACGTGNCASVIAANKLGLVDKEVKVIVPGGELKVNIEDDGVKMIGNASFICDGTYLF